MIENDVKRGVKRKRGNLDGSTTDLGTKLLGKLHHGLKDVRKAAKKAKTFETQKLIKKLKQLRKEDTNSSHIEDAEAQLDLLKHINIGALAAVALKSKIQKDRVLSDHEHIKAAVLKELTLESWNWATPGTPAAKVQARLLSSKYLAGEISRIVEALRSIIHPDESRGEEDDQESADSATPKTVARRLPGIDHAGPSTLSKVEALSDDEGDAAGWESGTVGGSGEELHEGTRPITPDEYSVVSDSSASDSSSEGVNDDPPNKISASKQSSIGKASTFLPSLSVGYIRGESDTDDSDAGQPDIQPRKNRRGQRARRAIWEKKYGRNANHKKKELEDGSRNARTFVVSRANRGRTSKNKVMPNGSSSKDPPPHDNNFAKILHPQSLAGYQSHDQLPAPSERTSHQLLGTKEAPLHPSWEAKRKAREKESASIVPSQGKKIVFA